MQVGVTRINLTVAAQEWDITKNYEIDATRFAPLHVSLGGITGKFSGICGQHDLDRVSTRTQQA